MASEHETTGEKAASTSQEALNKEQRAFAKKAIKALAKAFETDKKNFAILRVPNPEESKANGSATAPKLKEGDPGYDGEEWQEASRTQASRYIIRYVGLEPVATDRHIDEICEVGIDVNAKTDKKGKPKRAGWATPVYLVGVQHFDGSDMVMAPTVDIPVDV